MFPYLKTIHNICNIYKPEDSSLARYHAAIGECFPIFRTIMLPSAYRVKQVNKNSSSTADPHNPSKHQELLYLTFDTDDPNPQQHCRNFKSHVHKFGIMPFAILEILM